MADMMIFSQCFVENGVGSNINKQTFKQNSRFIQQFPVEKNNQQKYTEILNMSNILQTIYTAV